MVGLGSVAAGRDQLDDVAPFVAGPRVRRVGALTHIGIVRLFAAIVVSHHDIDASGPGIGLDVLRPVHRRRADEIGGSARLDQHVGLTGKSVGGGERSRAVDQLQPGERAVGVEAGHRQRALVEQGHIGGAVLGVVSALGDESIDILVPLVVARIDRDPAIAAHHGRGALVLEAAERRMLYRRRGRIVGIVFDDPAEAIRFVRLLLDVEAGEIIAPRGVHPRLDAVTLIVRGFRRLLRIAVEETVEILLARKNRAPRGDAARAVVERAHDPPAGGIGRGAKTRMTGGGPAQAVSGFLEREAAISLAVAHHRPASGRFLDLDHRKPVRRHVGLGLLARQPFDAIVGLAESLEHQLGVGVLVVHAKQAARRVLRTPRQRHIGHEVVVVTELTRLRGAALPAKVEFRRAGHDPVAPADEHARAIARRDVDRLVEAMRNLREGEAGGAGFRLRRRRPRPIQRQGCAQACRGEPAKHAPARQPGGDHVVERGRRRLIHADIFGGLAAGPRGATVVDRHGRRSSLVRG